jgi:aryl-alcohol dehydrogenase-like predicted oxidoreductase
VVSPRTIYYRIRNKQKQLTSFRLLEGHATKEGTTKYLQQAVDKGIPEAHFREFDGLKLSSLGMGTYLGDLSSEDDRAVEGAVIASVKSGAINVIDTAINYRAMKSEKCIGRALMRLLEDGQITRDRLFISTKNGYITNDGDFPNVDVMEYMQKMFISPGVIGAEDISSGYNVMNPKYLARCIDKSLANMHLATIDLVYIHNAFESWNQDVDRATFMSMLGEAFQTYEQYRRAGKLRYYGMATWTCFRAKPGEPEHLSLEECANVAEKAGGKNHGFRFIQLPYNLAYSEALLLRNQSVGSKGNLTILEAAGKLGIGVFTSIPLFQGRLLQAKIPDYGGLGDMIPKLLQIVRSSPSVIAPLVGHKKAEHVEENLRIAKHDPLAPAEFADAVKVLTGQQM